MWQNAAVAVQHLNFGIAMLVFSFTGSNGVIGVGTEEGSGSLSVTRALCSACPIGNTAGIRTLCHINGFRCSWVMPTRPHTTGSTRLHEAEKTALSNFLILKKKEHFKVKKTINMYYWAFCTALKHAWERDGGSRSTLIFRGLFFTQSICSFAGLFVNSKDHKLPVFLSTRMHPCSHRHPSHLPGTNKT